MYRKVQNWKMVDLKKMRIQLENVYENSIRKLKWKFKLEMEIKVYLEIGKKVYENNGDWEITKIEECGWKKKAVCKTARRAHWNEYSIFESADSH